MLFNSIEFLVFLPIVFALYWALKRRGQNILLLIASYVFYGWWDWRFLSLIVGSSIVDFIVAKHLHASEDKRKRNLLLGISLAVNLGALGFFKYFDFFIKSFIELMASAGLSADPFTLRIVLPVGISFYTFQTLSYTIDIWRRQMEPTEDVIEFFAFVSFFPQLVAGPIERASHLLGQFADKRRFDLARASDGCRQILWGFTKKVVIADRLAPVVSSVYSDPDAPVEALVVATLFFAFQIYCDFSGYSDIALGTARLFGFELMQNFDTPYFSRNVSEFWKRWHISLSTWFRDYVYIPLGGSRTSKPRQLWNTFVTFTLSGLWHGANWTFVVWGALHALFYVPTVVFGKGEVPKGRAHKIPTPRELLAIVVTFTAVCFGWIFFRAESVTHAFSIIGRILTLHDLGGGLPGGWAACSGLILGLATIEWFQRAKPHGLEIASLPRAARWLIYYGCVGALVLLGRFSYEPFIYFQF